MRLAAEFYLSQSSQI